MGRLTDRAREQSWSKDDSRVSILEEGGEIWIQFREH